MAKFRFGTLARGPSARIIDGISREVVQIPAEPAVRETFNQIGNFAVTGAPQEFSAFIRRVAGRWQKLLRGAGIRYD
jgi:tripartite-type tricarboxylate transporter receptor subunit TctC